MFEIARCCEQHNQRRWGLPSRRPVTDI